MKKHEAIRVLIEHSFLFSDEEKAKLLIYAEKMSEEEMYALGLLLAKEQQLEAETSDQMIKNIDELINTVEDSRKDE